MATPAAIPAATLLKSTRHVVPGALLVTEYLFSVPADYHNPSCGEIQLFARSVTKFEPCVAPAEQAVSRRPWMVFLQGGPGFGNPEPQDSPITRFVLNKGYQILFLDYRGVGLSTPVTADTIPRQASDQFEYLRRFRQDNNVRDLEAVRHCLTASMVDPEKRRWSLLGQSFGGWVSLTYLSHHPEGLREVFMTGGLASVSRTPDEVYQALFNKVHQRNMAYYKKFPEDIPHVRRIASYLHKKEDVVKLPGGGRLTPRRFLTLGQIFGFHGGIDNAHALILRMVLDLDQFGFLTRPTLAQFETHLTLDANPIYGVLHEAIYCHKNGVASNWAAQRVGQELADFRWLSSDNHGFDEPTFATDTTPLCFTGEMIFPFMFDDYPELSRMKDVAEMLAKFDQWSELYDEEQLRGNTVPVFAASYIEDMYVDYGLAKETAEKINGIRTFETNLLYHNAIRARSDEVLSELFKLRDDAID